MKGTTIGEMKRHMGAAVCMSTVCRTCASINRIAIYSGHPPIRQRWHLCNTVKKLHARRVEYFRRISMFLKIIVR